MSGPRFMLVPMDRMFDATRLRNRYLGLRHGTSKANAAGVIISRPESGGRAWGLTADGRRQVRAAAARARENGLLDHSTLIYSSGFLRALQSAEVARRVLAAAPVRVRAALRERDFGELELSAHTNYERVWVEDLAAPAYSRWQVEPVAAVLRPPRMSSPPARSWSAIPGSM